MNKYSKVHRLLLKWYNKKGRFSLPWRNTEEVYHIYISEIMLQQTQVSRVEEHYYPYFLKKYPTLHSLAKSSLDDLLSSWSGLGYYSRARNLHKTAQLCFREGLPESMQSLQKLPGIGRYTASAICSFGYNQPVGVVDTNIARVLKRYFALKDAKEALIWQRAEEFLNRTHPKEHNLALMDLGSMLCTPKNPNCAECPLSQSCQGKSNPEDFTQTKKVKYESLELFLGIYIKEEKLALVKSTQRLYKGMLTLPNIDPIDENFLATYKHSYTKYRISVHLYKVDNLAEDKVIWYEIDKLSNAPISSLTKKALEFIWGAH